MMMLPRTVMRMMGRRLALRKGLVISVAVLMLIGWTALLLVTNGHREKVAPSPLTTEKTRDVTSLELKKTSDNSSVSPTHPKLTSSHHPSRSSVVHIQHHMNTSHSTAVQCKFSAITRITGVDINLPEVVENEITFDDPDGGVWKQGYDIKYSLEDYRDQKLTVFVVPHSHNDPGWIRTFDEYFRKQTKNILDKMVVALSADPQRTFIWAEISFLALWWKQTNDHMREKFRKLVENGQLEIVTGGWVMNDEANTHYFAMTDQMIEGHNWLAHNLPGVVPRSGWAIDPFGYTPSMAYLLQQSGLSGMLIQRVHYSLKKKLSISKDLEFWWRQAWDRHGNTDIFTHAMPFYSYDIPHTCGPDPAICCQFDFKRLPGSKVKCPWKKSPQVITKVNVKERAEMLSDQYHKKAQLYRTNVLLVPLGDDFRWDGDKEINDQFDNYKKLMDYMNTSPELKIDVKFGTLAKYFTAVQESKWVESHSEEGNRAFPVLSGDFFTYSDRSDNYWSGYYTTRPFYKHMDRQLESRLRLSEILFSLTIARNLPTYPTLRDLLTSARQNLALFQHHDGITGTAKDKVVIDYGERMKSALENSNTIIQHSSQTLLLGNNQQVDSLHFSLGETRAKQDSLPQPAIIRLSLDGPQTLLIVNPLSTSSTRLISVTIDTTSVTVTDNKNVTVGCQVNPVLNDEGVPSDQHYQLLISATLPPLGFTVFHIIPEPSCPLSSLNTLHYSTNNKIFSSSVEIDSEQITLSNDVITAKFSTNSGLLLSLSDTNNKEVGVAMDVVQYGTRLGKEKSGAYLFLPDGPAHSLVKTPRVAVTTGPLVNEVVSYVGMVRVEQKMSNIAGIERHSLSVTTITDLRHETNKEVSLRLQTTIDNDNYFYTDLNGLQLIRRKTMSKLPLQGNFYPMPTMAFLQDAEHRLSVMSAQPQGVGSLQPGWLEMMLDRTLKQDDDRGLGQGIKDNKQTAAHFRILLETRSQPLAQTNPQLVYPSLPSLVTMDTLLHPAHVSFTSSKSPILSFFPLVHSLLSQPLACDLFLLNLRSDLSKKTALLLHRRGYDCNFVTPPLHWCPSAANETQVRLRDMFTGAEVTMAIETYLTQLEEKRVVKTKDLTVDVPNMEILTFSLFWDPTAHN